VVVTVVVVVVTITPVVIASIPTPPIAEWIQHVVADIEPQPEIVVTE
jgi:hypothetical protein